MTSFGFVELKVLKPDRLVVALAGFFYSRHRFYLIHYQYELDFGLSRDTSPVNLHLISYLEHYQVCRELIIVVRMLGKQKV